MDLDTYNTLFLIALFIGSQGLQLARAFARCCARVLVVFQAQRNGVTTGIEVGISAVAAVLTRWNMKHRMYRMCAMVTTGLAAIT
jgi:hypothetical protein